MVTKEKLEADLAHSRQRYAEYLKGKRVAIVGPAPSILNSKQKEKLENYDVIVRLNKAVPVPSDLIEDIGLRTDVLYNCMNPSQECGGFIDIDLLHKHGVKFLVSPYTHYKEYRFGQDNLDFAERNLKSNAPISFCHIDKKLFGRLMEIMKLPNTGVNAIIDVLHHDIKELYITGLTFFKGGYIKQYRGYTEKQVLARMAKYNLHDQEKQLAYMKKLLRNNPRVLMDQALSDIIYENDKVPVIIDSSLVSSKSESSQIGNSNLVIVTDLNQIQEIKSNANIPETATVLAFSNPVQSKAAQAPKSVRAIQTEKADKTVKTESKKVQKVEKPIKQILNAKNAKKVVVTSPTSKILAKPTDQGSFIKKSEIKPTKKQPVGTESYKPLHSTRQIKKAKLLEKPKK